MLINMTPHPVNICSETGDIVVTIPPSGQVLRLPEVTTPAGEVDGIPVVRKSLDPATDLPPEKEGVYYIVSLPAAQALRRRDFLVPDDLVRDEQGRVIGCRRFATIA
ncbi:hypothetical protein V3F56_03500 [Moorellaceae bacterium AZ2]